MSEPYDKEKSKKNASRLKEIILTLRKYHLHRGFTPQKLYGILEDLGPTYVKIGQILSMRQDMLPKAYCDELTKLRSNVKPLAFQEICAVLDEEYGCSYKEKFAQIDEKPLGSASIAQVHSATLINGQQVVIKVQRPNIYETMSKDITILKRAISMVKMVSSIGNVMDLRAVIDEIWNTAKEEMDFLMEAEHMDRFGELNSGISYITYPKVYHDLTTKHVLVMERIHGIPVDKVDKLKELGYDMNEIGQKLAENFVKQILDDAFFHADPHPGNIWIMDGKIAWLDFGMMGKLTGRDKELFRSAVTAIVNNDIYQLKNVFLTLGTAKQPIDHALLYTDVDEMVSRYGNLELGNMNLGVVFQEFMHVANKHHILLPQSVTMLGRGVMTIEGVLRFCAPDINLLQILATHMSNEFFRNLDWTKELKRTGKGIYTILNKVAVIPSQLSDLIQMTVKGQTKVNLDISGSEAPLKRIDSMVNRIVAAVIIMALIIGSSLLCLTEIRPMVGDIPLLAMLGYILAGIIGGILVFFMIRKKKK